MVEPADDGSQAWLANVSVARAERVAVAGWDAVDARVVSGELF